ncbi:hypothetical protein FGO68_gene2687 [Halteria grandinella]|uniref:Uncharacterized protein n=1 Tax=Halteria grandinella TaxID=5974 RepID=A0A8J8P567_HALGN|nr:hypothetical protein FGO68_gene2687 [Halteria grandinella]
MDYHAHNSFSKSKEIYTSNQIEVTQICYYCKVKDCPSNLLLSNLIKGDLLSRMIILTQKGVLAVMEKRMMRVRKRHVLNYISISSCLQTSASVSFNLSRQRRWVLRRRARDCLLIIRLLRAYLGSIATQERFCLQRTNFCTTMRRSSQRTNASPTKCGTTSKFSIQSGIIHRKIYQIPTGIKTKC